MKNRDSFVGLLQTRKIRLLTIVIVLSALCLFFYRCFIILDPDFGWHLRIGELIHKAGIPQTDPFSYTMQSYPFVDHEWVTDLLTAWLFHLTGYLGLALVFSLIALSALLIQVRFFRRQLYSIFPFILGVIAIFDFTAIRAQVLSWFCFSLLLVLLQEKKLWQKWRFGVPILFLIWANMHGGFAMGIVILVVFLVTKLIKERNLSRGDLLVVGLSLGATFINPYSYRLWLEIWQSLSDAHLRSTIVEWSPGIFFPDFAFWFLVLVSSVLYVRYFKSYSYLERLLYVVLLGSAVASMRNMPFFVLLVIPFVSKGFVLFAKEAESIKYASKRLAKAYRGLVLVAGFLVVPSLITLNSSPDELKVSTFYPTQAIAYLKSHPTQGQIFSDYNWGGYLDWQLPKKKVFIDGRMPSWRWNANKKGESNYAFKDYGDILLDKTSLSQQMHTYQIDTILWRTPSQLEQSSLIGQIRNYLTFAGPVTTSPNTFAHQLKKAKLQIVYQDKIATIYRVKK